MKLILPEEITWASASTLSVYPTVGTRWDWPNDHTITSIPGHSDMYFHQGYQRQTVILDINGIKVEMTQDEAKELGVQLIRQSL